MNRERKIVVLNLTNEGPVAEQRVDYGDIAFVTTEHRIGWDFKTAENLIHKYDGFVDGFAISGLQKKVAAGKTRLMHPGYLALMRAAVRTPIYLADDVRDFFADWTLQRVLKEQPQLFQGRKVLYHAAIASPFAGIITQAGGQLRGADALILTGVPVLLKGERQLERFLKAMKPLFAAAALRKVNPEKTGNSPRVKEKLAQWIREHDIFVTFGNLLERMDQLEALRDKIVVVDHINPALRERLSGAGVAQVVEFIPEHPAIEMLNYRHFSVLTAMIDQKRVLDDSPLGLDEYILKLIQDLNVQPNRLKSSHGIVRRCAFIVHPLSQKDMWKNKALRLFSNAPKKVRDALEYSAARVPPYYYGTIRGAVSQATGQEVICDLYALPATPRQILNMREEFMYQRLVDCAAIAQKRGAAMIGLGAYTKVIGDAGLTVSRRAPIPVTNGNSYSASTTLWAARVMVEKMNLISREMVDGRYPAKAMVIGATGSIGRVSALLVSLVFRDLVLVATRSDKLLELRQEILSLSPGVNVTVTTQGNPHLGDTDLIVTATSNQSGSILDMELVKPGAVICDCSRPLDIGPEEAAKRPDVMVIESGEVLLPGLEITGPDIGLPKPSVYACLAETVLLAMDGRFESFSLSKQLSMEKVKEIYKIGLKHGANLSAIRGPNGVITDEQVAECRRLALERLQGSRIV